MMDTLLQEAIDRPFQTGLVTISLGIVGYISLRALYRNRTVDAEALSKRKYPLPPGPPRDFLIGSVRHFPRSHIWEKFCEWQKQYGDIIHISLPGTSLVVLGSYESSQELLSKRPNATAGRAVTYMITNMMDLAWSFAFMQPGVHHSNQRKMMRKAIGPSRVGSHDPQIEQGCSNLMLKYSEFQGYVPAVTFDYLSQLIIRLTYGEQIGNTMGEELSKKNKEIIHLIVDAFFQVWVVDIFHFLRFIPSWFPGATFRRVGARGTALSNYVRYKPFEAVQKLYNSGNLGHSIVKDLLDEFGPDDDARDALAVLDTAGSDTTTAAICAFLHTMYLFPEIASKVFEETRQVTHGQRMLQIADRRHLPFTEAVWKESLRWNPFIPMG
ncbi:hypothetical protein FRC14_006019 [Serendipita sp. 396]|nr:hypothetical protein FRC14_006019 [Serendipita sp. 396]